MLELKDQDLLFYDIEVFPHDSFVVFKNINKQIVATFRNDFTGIYEVIKNKILIGFNNYFYDDKILSSMLLCHTPDQIKKKNDRIIAGRDKSRADGLIKSLDVFQEIGPNRPGLKKIEANMGSSILESPISFDHDAPLTESEYFDVLQYCSYDVDKTIDVFNLRRKSYFQPKLELLRLLGNEKAVKWNNTTISANLLLGGDSLVKWATHRVGESLLELVPPPVRDMWDQVNKPGADLKIKNTKVKEMGSEIIFGFGGLHGVNTRKKKFKNVILCDVASMYPSIISNLNILGKYGVLYEKIRTDRVELKKTDKVKADSYKLILNSVYGLLKNQYSALFNPRAADTVCIYGQIVLYELCKRLHNVPGLELVNINTDGVMFVCDNDGYYKAAAEWEKEFNLQLEFERYDDFIQRDVNNYIAKQGDEIKVKGGDVGRYNGDAVFRKNCFRIVDKCLVDHLILGKDILDIIIESMDDVKLFQMVLACGSTFSGTYDKELNKYNKINRIFACKESTPDRLTLYKKRSDDKGGGLVSFPDAPENMLLYNDELSTFDRAADLDINFYYKLVQNKLKRWV